MTLSTRLKFTIVYYIISLDIFGSVTPARSPSGQPVVKPAAVWNSLGGQPAKLTEFPHQAMVRVDQVQESPVLCGGAIVSKLHVLTAATCVTANPKVVTPARSGRISVTYGSDNLKSSIMKKKVDKVMIHHHFYRTPSINGFDLAVLKCDSEFIETKWVHPIGIPEGRYSKGNLLEWMADLKWNCRSASYGQETEEDDLGQIVLMKYTFRLLKFDDCAEMLAPMGLILNKWAHLCAMSTDAIQPFFSPMDVGNVLVCNINGRDEAWGVASWATNQEEGTYPFVFARVDSHYQFITRNILLNDVEITRELSGDGRRIRGYGLASYSGLVLFILYYCIYLSEKM